MLSQKPAAGPSAPTHDESQPHIDAPVGNAKQEAHDKVMEGLQVLAAEFPAAKDLMDQFDKQYQTWIGGGEAAPQGPKGPDEGASIPSSNDMPQVEQPVADQQPDRGGPAGERGKPFWQKNRPGQ